MGTQRYGIVWSVKHLYAKAKPSRELIGKGIAQQGKAMKWHSGATQHKGTVKRSRDEQRHCKAFISQGIAWNSIDKNGGCETSAPKIKGDF